jgi:hypothetical protein
MDHTRSTGWIVHVSNLGFFGGPPPKYTKKKKKKKKKKRPLRPHEEHPWLAASTPVCSP